MAALNVNGYTVTISDSFLKLSPAEQNAAVEEIAATLPKKAEQQGPPQLPVGRMEALQRGAVQGATLGFGDELAAVTKAGIPDAIANMPGGAVLGPLAGAFLGGPRLLAEKLAPDTFGDKATQTYANSVAESRAKDEQARSQRPGYYIGGEVAGGVATAVPATLAGLTAMRFVDPALMGVRGLAARSAASAVDGATLGALSGAGNAGEGERLAGALTGGATGAAVGGAVPGLVAGAGATARAMGLGPQAGVARDRVLALLQRSRMTPDDVAAQLQAARAAGIDDMAVMDALGRSGQAEAGRLTRSASPAGDDLFRVLEDRQGGAVRRMTTALDEAGTRRPGRTAEQLKTELDALRSAKGDVAYNAAEAGAGPVDVSAAIRRADNIIAPGVNKLVNPGSGIADDTLERAITSAKALLTDGKSVLSDYNSVRRAKSDIQDMADAAMFAGKKNRASELGGIARELDAALVASSPRYAAARNQFRNISGAIDAVDTGAKAARSGRSEDTIRKFNEMTSSEQGGMRAGYASKLVEDVRGVGRTGDVTRPLTAPDVAAEIPTIFPGSNLPARTAAERKMFETYAEAAKGSATARRLSEDAAGGSGFGGMVGQALTGNVTGAARKGVELALQAARGERVAARDIITQVMMEKGPTEAKAALTKLIKERGVKNITSEAAARAVLSAIAVPALTQ